MIEDAGSQPQKRPRFFYGYIVVGAAFFIMVLAYGIRTTFGVFFKPMLVEFDWSRGLTSGALTLSMLVQGIWGIFMGRVNDRIGSRWVVTLCCFLLALGLGLMSLTRYSWQLYLFYGVIIGVGMGGVFVAITSTIARWFVKKRGTMTGIVLAGIGAGTLTMAPVSNWLISVYGWRGSYAIVGGLVLVIGVIVAQFLRRDPAGMGQVPDGQNEVEEQKLNPAPKGLSLKEAVNTGQFWMASAVFVCIGYCTFTISVHLVPHITDLGISAATAANVMAIIGLVESIGGIVLGIVADSIKSKRVIAISLILISATLFWLVPIATVPAFFLFAVVYSFGIGGATTMESTIVAEMFGMKSHGVILGAISFAFTVGAAIGPLVTGYLFDITGNYRLAFLICAISGVAGLIMTLLLRPIKKLTGLIQ